MAGPVLPKSGASQLLTRFSPQNCPWSLCLVYTARSKFFGVLVSTFAVRAVRFGKDFYRYRPFRQLDLAPRKFYMGGFVKRGPTQLRCLHPILRLHVCFVLLKRNLYVVIKFPCGPIYN